MRKFLEFRKYPLDMILEKLLIDKTTRKNIIWATDSYSEYGDSYCDRYEITLGALQGINPILIQPRAFKAIETQQQRTKSKAEVFTPSWIVNKMISHLDEEWFGRPNIFNVEDEQSWKSNTEKIDFKERNWKDYVVQTVLEITCGEAPFIVSRYNASTGEIIPIEDRIGILDRKLRVVTENTGNEEDWLKWTKRAFESVYGYEYQGDNLLIGRINLLMTFLDYYQSVWKKDADKSLLVAITNIITWNFWQMDGLNGTVPLGVPKPLVEQMTLFDIEEEQDEKAPLCKVRKWRTKKTILYKGIETKEGNGMSKRKFDVVIGNPPYQIEAPGTSTSDKPIYHNFIDEAQKIGNQVELITPGRFLFNAGATPKQWNERMLNDPHFSVLMYEQKSADVFPNTDIKGGVAVTYWNRFTELGPIITFTPFEELNSILRKVEGTHPNSLTKIIYNQTKFNLDNLYSKYPSYRKVIGSDGKDKRLRNNIFEKIDAFSELKKTDCDLEIKGLINNKRVSRYIERDVLDLDHENLFKWKVLVPRANGSGALGEVLSTPLIGQPLIGQPLIGHTQSFISIGAFDTEEEANAAMKYVKSKFARTMLGILKITQDNPPEKWKYVPLQDFTSNSDIDWSKSIPEIDQQLYKKYGLSPEEIKFIEIHVKEME
ncbi:Eco57I restriction-modification methylase domain-containing protein [Dubosiella newyorkensis]|uniref:Eco57I restriction-modification methylase domain-containing protein n=1 Tax=Dubosiella newyorkensis TaxID=1862672 RepID=UPI00272D1D8B|nr:Eco57I restriction-modification methylase domain-containing protein [Dubosiella newyorkensis]